MNTEDPEYPPLMNRMVPPHPSRTHRLAVILAPLMMLAIAASAIATVYYQVLEMHTAGMLAMALCAALIGAGKYGEWRSLQDLRAHQGLLCFICTYPLDTVQGDRCPECGQRFTPKHLRTKWAQHFPMLKWKEWCPRDVPPLYSEGHG